jgi:hypothetical protein
MDLFLADLIKEIPVSLSSTPNNWHQMDALMALTSGLRHQKNEHLSIGETNEGIIII